MRRREGNSSALSFMDCICCGFGAVLLLFILTAKQQIIQSQVDASRAVEAAQTLQVAIEEAEARQKALDKEIAALDPQPDAETASLAELAAEQERLAKAVEQQTRELDALEVPDPSSTEPAGLDRPSADQSYLSGLRLRGPRAVLVLENSGSMLAESASEAIRLMQGGQPAQSEKWTRAKAAVRAVLAAIPQGTRVAVFQMNEATAALSGSAENPYIDPYDNAALIALLERLDRLEASGGADLGRAVRTIGQLRERPSSLLLIGDGLPTAPSSGGSLSETDRVRLFNAAVASGINYPFNSILLPFTGDPAAAGLFWQLSGRTNGITLIPDEDWPAL